VKFYYSHPPLLERIGRLLELRDDAAGRQDIREQKQDAPRSSL